MASDILVDEIVFDSFGFGDTDLLLGLMRKLREDDPDEGAFDETAARRALADLPVDGSAAKIWLIRHCGAPVGYVAITRAYSLEFGGVIAFVDELLVERQYRGRGIGKRALAFAEEQAAVWKARNVFLEVTRSNDLARQVYESAGYVDRPHQWMYKNVRSATS